jgi:hypothetical protein
MREKGMRHRRDPFRTLIVVLGLVTTVALLAAATVPLLRHLLDSPAVPVARRDSQ